MSDLISGQDAVFMLEALKEAEAAAERGDYGIGAVVVHDGRIISRNGNEIMSRGERQWAHAEFLALEKIRDGELYVPKRAGELTVYTTLGPCPQCWGTMMINGIGRIVYGAGDPISTQDYATSVPPIFQSDKRQIVELGGDLGTRCKEIFESSRVAIDAKLGYKAQN